MLSPQVETAHLILSYPLDKRGLLTLFHSNFYSSALSTLVKNPSSQALVIYGDRDEFTSAQSYADWEEQLRKDAGNHGRLRIEVVHGASHFWAANRRHAEEMCRIVDEWLTQ